MKKEEDGEVEKTEEEEEEKKEEEKKEEESTFVVPDSNPLLEKLPPNVEELVTGLDLDNEDDDKKEYPLVVNEDLAKVKHVFSN